MATLPGKKIAKPKADAEISLKLSPSSPISKKEPKTSVTPAPVKEPKISVPPTSDINKIPEQVISGDEPPATAKPPETAKAQAERLFLRQQKQDDLKKRQKDQAQRLYEKMQMQYFNDLAEGVDSVFIDLFDLLPNAAIETMDLLIAADRNQRGLFPAASPTFGVERETLDSVKKVIKSPFRQAAEWGGMLTKPEDRPPVFGLKPGQNPPESEQHRFGRWMAENALFTMIMPYLSKLPYPKGKIQPYATERGFSLKEADLTKMEKVRRFFSGAGKSALEADPLKHKNFWNRGTQTAAIEMGFAGFGGGLGEMYARRNYPDSLALQFAMPVAGASIASGLLYRSVWGGLVHMKDTGVNKYGGVGAIEKAKKRVQDTVENREQTLRNLNDIDQFIPEVLENMTVAERSMDRGMVSLYKAFIKEAAEHLELEDNIRWKKIHDMLMEIAVTPQSVDNISYSQAAIRKALTALNETMDVRISATRTKLQKKLAEAGTKLTAQQANQIAKELLIQEQKIFIQTERELWNRLPMDTLFPTASIHTGFENILRSIRPESGKNLLDLTDSSTGRGGAKALYDFLGNLKSVTHTNIVTGEKTVTKVFVPGSWGDSVDLRGLQDLKSRIGLEIRKERALDAPNKYKISKLIELDEAFLHALGGLERKGTFGPMTKETNDYSQALYFSRQFKTKFGQKHIYSLFKTDKRGNAVPDDLTLMKIFQGTEAETGATVVTEFIKAMENIKSPLTDDVIAGTPGVVEELLGAMENLIKYRFYTHAVSGNVINPVKAETFIKSNKQLFDKFPGLRDDFNEAVSDNNIAGLRESRYNKAGNQLQDERTSITTIYIKDSPNKAFNDLFAIADETQFNKELNRLIRLTEKEYTGKARDGLDGAFLQWLMKKVTHESVSSLKGKFVSGLQLKELWETTNVQRIANKLLSKKKLGIMKKVIRHYEAQDIARLTHAARGGVFNDVPNKMVESFLRVMFLRVSPLPPSGAASIAQAQLVSNRAADIIKSNYRDPVIKYMTDAFLHNGGDMDRMMVLFSDINDPSKIPYIMKQVNAFFVTAGYNLGEKVLEEMEAEELEKKETTEPQQ